MVLSKINRDYIEPEVLTDLSRRTLADYEINSPDSLASYLPSQFVPDVEYELTKNSKDLIKAANWRSFGGQATSDTWGLGEQMRGRLMPLAANYVLDEETMLRQRNDRGDAIGRRASELVIRATKRIALQINYQRGQAIANGILNLRGPGGFRQEVDFGRKAEFTTTAAHLFTDETYNPIDYIEDLCEMYEEENGFRPEKILMSRKVKRAIYSHPLVVRGAIGDVNNPRARATDPEVRRLLDDYDLPEIEVFQSNARVKLDDLDGGKGATKTVPLLPEDSLLFTPRNGDPIDPESTEFGRTLWGTTISADLPDFNLSGSDLPGIVSAVIFEGWPASMEVISDAIAMPVVYNPNYTLKAKVI